ncbi:unnamed protein product [Adineta ricciae]|uniref:MARVEL domain-containing protein n=1 Tax=Adineta ricciae TaxID=249248 RepID=A0A815GE74_ADIRI|nr:unnamed protein product [Adineta ricciae]
MFPQSNYPVAVVKPIVQPRYQTVNDFIPNFLPGLLGAGQLFLWMAILGLEIASVYYDAGRGTIYAGFWCSIVFFVTWIAMFSYLCCGKSSGCGTYLVIQNIINIIFAIILTIFTARFVKNPCLCYGALCYIPNWDFIYNDDFYDYLAYPCTERTFKKLSVLKALLACAILMLVCNFIFIIAYIVASIRFRNRGQSNSQQMNVAFQQQPAGVHVGIQPVYYPSAVGYPSNVYHQSVPIQYPSAPPNYYPSPDKY